MQFEELITIIMASPIWIVAIILLVLMIIWDILATDTNGDTNENKERKTKWSTVVTGRYAQNKYVQETSEKIRNLLSLNATYLFNNVSICGRTAADGMKLHVDHIMPVAKRGKTEMNNLRTLCNQCNSGQSDKWDEDGLN